MSTSVEAAQTPPQPVVPAAARRGSLLRAEVARFLSRRFIQLLVLLGVVALLLGTAIASTQFARATDAELAVAQQRLEEQRAMDQRSYEQCLEDPLRPPEVPAEVACGDPADVDYQVSFFLDRAPFLLSEQLPPGVLGVGVATAALLFLVGATSVGAEWSSRSIVALLFWEPRRLKVMGTKVAVTAAFAAAIAVLAQVLWLGAAFLLASARGEVDASGQLWQEVAAAQGRVVLLGVLAALLGFAIAHLVRNTGAALGVGFVYFAVVETGVRLLLGPTWHQLLVTDNVAALVTRGGHVLHDFTQVEGGPVGAMEDRVIEMSNLQGGLTLAVYCLGLLVVGGWLFRQRDLH